MTNLTISSLGNLDFGHLGWKYYHTIKKKAMEQEFSWSGLVISLSIAFFIVILTAFSLNTIYNSLGHGSAQSKALERRLYLLEASDSYSIDNYIIKDYISPSKIEVIQSLPLA